MAALEQLIRLPGESWHLYASTEHVETILRHGVAGDEVDREMSKRLIGILARDHNMKLLHLLRDADGA